MKIFIENNKDQTKTFKEAAVVFYGQTDVFVPLTP
jgi:hypothetical protein